MEYRPTPPPSFLRMGVSGPHPLEPPPIGGGRCLRWPHFTGNVHGTGLGKVAHVIETSSIETIAP